MAGERDFWLCKEGQSHELLYRGRADDSKGIVGGYRCKFCGFRCTKSELKEATDHA
jgi:hypothetical protein